MDRKQDWLDDMLLLPPSSRHTPGACARKQDQLDDMLWLAVKAGNLQKVQKLVGKGARVDAEDGGNWQPLHHAAGYGHKDIVVFLLGKGADVNAVDLFGTSPLHFAAEKGHADVIEILIQSGALVRGGGNDGRQPLHDAARHGHAEAVDILLKNGAAVDDKDWGCWQPLHYAAYHGREDVVALLLRKGADWTARTDLEKTPLELAEKHPAIRDLLKNWENPEFRKEFPENVRRAAWEDECAAVRRRQRKLGALRPRNPGL